MFRSKRDTLATGFAAWYTYTVETNTPAATRDDILQRIKEWPDQPGVYLMRDAANRILYVGKAKNLRNRIRSYFQAPEGLTPKTRLLMKRVADLEFTVTNTELEALLLECNLIKKHRPRYNIRLKDDKNYPYVVLDFTQPFPQFRITRRVVISPHLKYFGPFSGGVREISRFLLKTFRIRDCSDSKFKNRTRPCLNYEIGTCTAPCVGLVNQEDYSRQIREASLFLQGRKQQLMQDLRKEMLEASSKMEYEKAKISRDKIQAVEMITAKQNAVLTQRHQDIDVIGCFPGDNELQWVVLFVRAGFLTGRRAEKTQLILDSVEDTTRSFIEQFYTISLIPDEIWIASDFAGRETIESFLSERAGKKVRLQVKRSETPMRLLGMAYENAKLIYQEAQKRGGGSASQELQKILGLAECPHSIEGIDVSNFQGQLPAVALVHFAAERPLKARYRLFYPKTVEGQNDFAMIYETVLRRFSKPENPPPDLLLIDGGKGQLASAVRALEELKIDVPVLALAKARTQSAFTRKEVEHSEERIFVPNRKNPIVLKEGHPALRLLQQVRDEAHRFSVKSHRVRRKNRAFQESSLTDIAGVGPKTRARLLQRFGSLAGIREASVQDLMDTGLSEVRAMKLRSQLTAPGGQEE